MVKQIVQDLDPLNPQLPMNQVLLPVHPPWILPATPNPDSVHRVPKSVFKTAGAGQKFNSISKFCI